MKTFLILVLIITANVLQAQKIIINGKEGARLLQWNDFAGKADDNSSFYAYTSYKTGVKFTNVEFDGDKAILKGFEMTLEFDAGKSWVKKGKETTALLKHEQGHFDVGLLFLAEVLQKMSTASFTKQGFKQEFQQLMNETQQKYRDMGKRYDDETDHSIKKEEQEKWNLFFDKEVKR